MSAKNITLFGIPNCDTVKKARKWLEANGIEFTFHDFRKDGLEPEQVKRWIDALGWETVLNRKGTTWRKLPDDVKAGVNATTITALLVEQPTLIKRPVLVGAGTVRCGFNEADYQAAFNG